MKKTIIFQNDGTQSSPLQNSNFDLFVKNIFTLIANREEVMKNHKMSHAIVEANNHLAYTGNSGLKNTTLGSYLNMWANCPQAIDIDSEGYKWVVCQIAGSPLTGNNSCLVVSEDGRMKFIQHPNFKQLWKSLMKSNEDFSNPTLLQEAYSLQEVLDMLPQSSAISDREVQIFFLERILRYERDTNNSLRKTNKVQLDRIKENLINSKNEELQPLMSNYAIFMDGASSHLSMISKLKSSLRKKLKQGLIDNHRYQRIFSYLKARDSKIRNQVIDYRNMVVNTLFKGENINFSDILTYYPMS